MESMINERVFNLLMVANGVGIFLLSCFLGWFKGDMGVAYMGFAVLVILLNWKLLIGQK